MEHEKNSGQQERQPNANDVENLIDKLREAKIALNREQELALIAFEEDRIEPTKAYEYLGGEEALMKAVFQLELVESPLGNILKDIN